MTMDARTFTMAPVQGLLARILLFALLLKIPGLTLFPAAALVVGLVLLPVIIPRLRFSKLTAAHGIAGIVALLSGVFAILTTQPEFGTPGDAMTIATMVGWIICIPVSVALAVWGVQQVGLLSAGRLVALGGLVNALLNELPHTWKGSLGIYATVFVLLLLVRAPVGWSRAALIGSAVLSAFGDARFMAILAILALLCTFATTGFASRVKAHPVRSVVVILGGFGAIVWGALTAMRLGVLGPTLQYRTELQLASGRPLIESFRTEWAASLHLFSVHPFGFGIGESIDRGLARVAISHVQAVGGDYLSGYLPYTVFGQRVDLHSMLADLWYHFGIGGVLFAGSVAAILVMGIPHTVRSISTFGPAPVFMVLVGMWDLMFSPMGNSDRLIAAVFFGAAFIINANRPDAFLGRPARPGRQITPRPARRVEVAPPLVGQRKPR